MTIEHAAYQSGSFGITLKNGNKTAAKTVVARKEESAVFHIVIVC